MVIQEMSWKIVPAPPQDFQETPGKAWKEITLIQEFTWKIGILQFFQVKSWKTKKTVKMPLPLELPIILIETP